MNPSPTGQRNDWGALLLAGIARAEFVSVYSPRDATLTPVKNRLGSLAPVPFEILVRESKKPVLVDLFLHARWWRCAFEARTWAGGQILLTLLSRHPVGSE